MIFLKHVDRAERKSRREEETVTYGPPIFLSPLTDVVINEGERARFEAKVQPVGDPSMTVEWFFNRAPIAASKRKTIDVTTFGGNNCSTQ